MHENVIKCYRSWDVGSQEFGVRIGNKLPHARLLLVLEQSLIWKADRTLLHVTSLQVLVHNSMLCGYFESIGTRETLPCLLVGLVNFCLAFRGWRVEWFWLYITHSSLFLDSISEFLKIFAKRDKVPQMVPSIAQVVFVTSPKVFERAQLPTLWLVCGSLGRISMRLTCAT
jgi:hypothetical protein